MIQGALGITTEQFVKWEERAWDKFNDTHSNFKLRDATPMHKNDIEAAMERYRPALVVIDQLDKIKGFKADREDVMFGAIYCWARELAKKYCPVIGVCQAAASAENKKWLTMDDIAKSKTEKPAEADFIIGIGKTHTVGEEDIRYLHLVKNKLTGIHAKITCMIQADIARFKDI